MPVTDPNFNPSGDPLVDEIKTRANDLAEVIERIMPGRRRSVALTYLETAAMYAVKAAVAGDT